MATEAVTLFTEIRSWLEILYFISGIVVMFLVGLGLRQLTLAKNQIHLAREQLENSKEIFKTQSKRAAVEAAVVECRRFSETIVLEAIALEKYCKDNEITYFKDVVFTRTENGFSVDRINCKKEDVKKLSGATEIINRYLNGLEAYSLFFLSGVADEKIAFHTNAKTFVELAENGFKLFPICNVDDEDAEPVKTLYLMWRKKIEARKMEVEKGKLEKKLSEYKEVKIKPIGT